MSDQQEEEQPTTLSDRWNRAVALVESSPSKALLELNQLQRDIAALALFSPNETLEDVSSKSLPLLSVEYSLGMAHLSVPTPPGHAKERKAHILKSMEFFNLFLQRLEQYELLSKQDTAEYHDLLEQVDNEQEPRNNTNNQTRQAKIERYRAKQEAQQETERLRALQERRGRLGATEKDEMDGHDEESLERTLALTVLNVNVSQAIEEWHQAKREIPMVEMMISMEQQQQQTSPNGKREVQEKPPPSNKPLQLTHITKDNTTGQLNIRKQEIQSQVFRPSWNQPTMSLEELGEMEVAQAREREARQHVSELQQKQQPRRYEQLVKDGMEDDADLVDASAAKDRAWDDFKDANPRGSGNKMGDRGDRNF